MMNRNLKIFARSENYRKKMSLSVPMTHNKSDKSSH